jgi:hypothetical protein
MINYGDLTIGKSYLRYLWITDMTNNKAPSVIYVPTEANCKADIDPRCRNVLS